MRLDTRNSFPSGMEEYLSYYGWHFSKKMEEWAASKMYKEVSNRKNYIIPYTLSEVKQIFKDAGVELKEIDYDAVYVANMARADFLGSSIEDEAHLAKYVKDVCEDSDAYDGIVFTRFYADCIGRGCPIHWEDMI